MAQRSRCFTLRCDFEMGQLTALHMLLLCLALLGTTRVQAEADSEVGQTHTAGSSCCCSASAAGHSRSGDAAAADQYVVQETVPADWAQAFTGLKEVLSTWKWSQVEGEELRASLWKLCYMCHLDMHAWQGLEAAL